MSEEKNETKRQVEVDAQNPQMEVGERVEISKPLGEGAMCVVRGALDRNLLRPTAIKLLHPELARDDNTRRRMIEEAQITAQLDHPNILPVYELGETEEGELYFTMKVVAGQNLQQLLYSQNPAARTDAELLELVQILIKVCDALAFAHSHGVVHRDIKPDNIMLGEFGEVYLMDWGISKLREQLRQGVDSEEAAVGRRGRPRIASQDGKYVGTPYYMSPEQARGDHAATDERSDVFAIGAIIYETLIGVPPFDAERIMEVLKLAAACEVVPPQERVPFPLPPKLCAIAMKAMTKDPTQRYQTAAEVKAELLSFMQSGWHFPVERVAPGEDVVTEGEAGDCAYIISTGTCRVYKEVGGKQVELAELGPGDVFGETAVFTDEARGATVRAVDRVELKVVPREFFESDIGSGQALGLFVKAVARRFNERNQRALELEHEAEHAEMLGQIYRYLVFAGENVDEGRRREAPWSRLREQLMARFNHDEDGLLELLQEDPMLELDIGRDIIALGRI